MEYKLLGKSGLRVSELCVRIMTFEEDGKCVLKDTSKEESKQYLICLYRQVEILLILLINTKWDEF